MILLEKKLDIFNKIIYANKKKDYEKKLLEVKNSNQNELKDYEQKLIDEYNLNLKKRTRKAEQKSIEKLRTAEQESRRELLVLKENIILVFLACLGAGYLLGLIFDRKKVYWNLGNEQDLPPFWSIK